MVACHVCPFSHFDPPYGYTPLLSEGVTQFPSEPLPPNSNSLDLCYETLALTCLCLWTVKLEKVEKELRLGTYYMPGRVRCPGLIYSWEMTSSDLLSRFAALNSDPINSGRD